MVETNDELSGFDAFCNSREWGSVFSSKDVRPCWVDGLLQLLALLFILASSVVYLKKLKRYAYRTTEQQENIDSAIRRGQVPSTTDMYAYIQMVDDSPHLHRSNASVFSLFGFCLFDKVLVLGSIGIIFVRLLLLFVQYAVEPVYPYQLFGAICQVLSWVICAYMMFKKAQKNICLTWHIRGFLWIEMVIDSIKLRTSVMSVVDGSGTFFDDSEFVIFGCVLSLCFFGICFNDNANDRFYERQQVKGDQHDAAHRMEMERLNVLGMDSDSMVSGGGEDAEDSDQIDDHYKDKDSDLHRHRLSESPERFAGLLSRLSYWWMNGILKEGKQKQLQLHDLYPLHPHERCRFVKNQFKAAWNQQTTKPKPSLSMAIRGAFGRTFIIAGLLKAIYDCLMFMNPMLLHLTIGYLNKNSTDPTHTGYYYVFGFFFNAMAMTAVLHQYFHRCFRFGMRVKSAIIAAVYEKSLRLTPAARAENSTGTIVNLMSTDANRLQRLFPYLHIIWSGPLQITLAMVFLWNILGVSVLAGLATMIFIMLPLNLIIARKIKKMQELLMGFKDSRVKETNEILTNMKIIKMYAWENRFADRVSDIRNMEVEALKKYVILNVINSLCWRLLPDLVMLATFSTYTLTGNTLTVSKAFTSIVLFQIMRFPMTVFPYVVNNLVEAQVSIKRLTEFLLSPELEPAMRCSLEANQALCIKNGNYFWDEERTKPAVSKVDISVRRGEFTMVAGQTGSGKTALLMALIGELPSGPLTQQATQGSVAYVAQTAWICNATVRENILFGKPYDKALYEQVIYACSLASDLAIFPAGDQTEIGAKGINLSGGQKQRIALARAVYQDRDVYLLDDTLSAVDAHVGKHIFTHCIRGLLADKTIVFVSHGKHYLPHADKIWILDYGRIISSGSYAELQEKGIEFSRYLESEGDGAEDSDASKDDGDAAHAASRTEDNHTDSKETEDRDASEMDGLRKRRGADEGSDPQKEIDRIKRGSLVDEEKRKEGNVTFAVYKTYFRHAGGYILWIGIICAYFLFMVLSITKTTWLAEFSDSNEPSSSKAEPEPGQDPTESTKHEGDSATFFLTIYSIIIFGGLLVYSGALIMLSYGSLKASRVFHSHLLDTIIRAPMYIFDTTPIGRMLNRFSKDLNIIDEELRSTMASYIGAVFRVLEVALVITYVSNWFLLAMVPVGFIYTYTQKYYIATSREIERLDSVYKSPIYSHFSESLDGTSSIRAFNAQKRFTKENFKRVDMNQTAYYMKISLNRWLATRLELVGSIVVTVSALFAVMSRDSSGYGAMSISYALGITQTLNWMVRMTSERETALISVERIKEYMDFPREAKRWSDITLPDGWPQGGEIEFQNFSMRYRKGLDLVLHDFTCKIESQSKVGIVGRTGAGKSSLMLALLRIVEGERGRGSIRIDGVDIASVGLHDLRQHIAIIPQEPVLFTGTIRFNLDPFDSHPDSSIWNALELAHLADHIRMSIPEGLYYTVSEGGSNFSVGQRQLLCLARALLRNTKILLLDEATSGIDHLTDQLVQDTIRKQFTKCTVLTIAHRLDTVMDSDQVIVMGEGQALEMGPPSQLLEDPNSHFYSIVQASQAGQNIASSAASSSE